MRDEYKKLTDVQIQKGYILMPTLFIYFVKIFLFIMEWKNKTAGYQDILEIQSGFEPIFIFFMIGLCFCTIGQLLVRDLCKEAIMKLKILIWVILAFILIFMGYDTIETHPLFSFVFGSGFLIYYIVAFDIPYIHHVFKSQLYDSNRRC